MCSIVSLQLHNNKPSVFIQTKKINASICSYPVAELLRENHRLNTRGDRRDMSSNRALNVLPLTKAQFGKRLLADGCQPIV